jgi:hypothetical protein
VTLTASVDPGSTFQWFGCRNPSGTSCIVGLDANRTIGADFHTPQPLRFDLTGAVGLALRPEPGSIGSTLEAVSPAGQLTPAVDSGSASVAEFLIGPSNEVYVLFAEPVNFDDTTVSAPDGCLLAKFDPATGVPVCVDDSLRWIGWPNSDAAQPIQFDAAGAAYYVGGSVVGQDVLRRSLNGVTTDLVTGVDTIRDFLVLPDGSVLLESMTASSPGVWTLRHLSPDGSLQDLGAIRTTFFALFPDGNAYMGLWDPDNFAADGVKRYLAASNELEPKYWIGNSFFHPLSDMYFNASDFCSAPVRAARDGFCNESGAFVQRTVETSDGSVYAAVSSGAPDTFAQYYPTVQIPPTAVQGVRAAEAVGTKIVLAGLNASGQNVLTLYDTLTTSESQLGASNQFQIYHLKHVPNSSTVMFDGLRLADNKYVVGQVDLSTGQVSASTALPSKLNDFQTFR